MIRVQLAKEYRQPDPEGQQTYGKQELLHNGPAVIQRKGERWRRAASLRTCEQMPPAAIRSTEKLAVSLLPVLINSS